jgi:hypothetical protein
MQLRSYQLLFLIIAIIISKMGNLFAKVCTPMPFVNECSPQENLIDDRTSSGHGKGRRGVSTPRQHSVLSIQHRIRKKATGRPLKLTERAITLAHELIDRNNACEGAPSAAEAWTRACQRGLWGVAEFLSEQLTAGGHAVGQRTIYDAFVSGKIKAIISWGHRVGAPEGERSRQGSYPASRMIGADRSWLT